MSESQEEASRYADRLEQVYQAYERSLDLDIAFTIVPMSDEVRARMKVDPDLNARVLICDARVKEQLITDLRNIITDTDSEGVKLKAIKEFGRTMYPMRFKEKMEGSFDVRHTIIVDDIPAKAPQ